MRRGSQLGLGKNTPIGLPSRIRVANDLSVMIRLISVVFSMMVLSRMVDALFGGLVGVMGTRLVSYWCFVCFCPWLEINSLLVSGCGLLRSRLCLRLR